LPAANESTGARGEIIVDITHSLVVERSYFMLVSSSVEASFAASCLYRGDLLVNSPILYSTFLSRCQATPSIRALGSNQPVHFVSPFPTISCCFVTRQGAKRAPRSGGVDSCRRKALYPFFLQVTLEFRLCLLLFLE